MFESTFAQEVEATEEAVAVVVTVEAAEVEATVRAGEEATGGEGVAATVEEVTAAVATNRPRSMSCQTSYLKLSRFPESCATLFLLDSVMPRRK